VLDVEENKKDVEENVSDIACKYGDRGMKTINVFVT